MITPANTKMAFMQLPMLRGGPEGMFAARVFFCTFDSQGPNECTFFVRNSERGLTRPVCSDHPEARVACANTYVIDRQEYRYHL